MRLLPPPKVAAVSSLVTAALALAGCGGDSGAPQPPPGVSQSVFERQLRQAQNPSKRSFPVAGGRSLEQLAAEASAGPKVGLASSVIVPGRTNRLAFGVLSAENQPVYGETAVYVARSPQAPAQGPYPAPADSLIGEPRYRSRQAVAEDSPLAFIYAAQVPFFRAGRHAVLVLTRTARGLTGAGTEVEVRSSRIPDVGERAPAIETDVGGIPADANDTRLPPAPDLHKTSFADAIGKRPVALLFATPQLCQSRVCGPVVDIALQLKQKYGDRMTFIHQEVYVDNDLNKGLRPPLRRFGLQTEPWLFTFDRSGRVAARLEGSFGLRAFERAIQAAL